MTIHPRLLTLGTLALLSACGGGDQPPAQTPQVGVVTIKAEETEVTTELPGRIVAVETSEVRPQISGIIRRRLFEEGAMVRAGQILYEIDDAPYRAALASAQGNLAQAQATIASTRAQADRYRSLIGINAVSRQELDNAVASAQQASASVATQKAAVQSAQVNLGFTRIRAPISGQIGRSLITPGSLVQTGQTNPLATIQRTDRVYVDIQQSAAQVLNLKEALRDGGLSGGSNTVANVQLLLPNGKAYPIEGRLQFSEVTVDPQSGSVTLRAVFPNPDGLLLPGMYVRAKIVEGVKKNAILAPQQGVTRDPRGNATVSIVNAQNKVEVRKVTADRVIGDKWLITSGLKPGDRLIVEAPLMLQPGTLVKPGAPQQIGGAANKKNGK